MVVLSDAAANAMLDAYYGSGHATGVPADHQLALFDADPRAGGVELGSSGGYTRVTVPNDGTSWDAAAGGIKQSTPIEYAAATGPWSDEATWWVLFAGDTLCDGAELAESINVTGAGSAPVLVLVVSYETELL